MTMAASNMLQFIQRFSFLSIYQPLCYAQRNAGTRTKLAKLGFPEKPKKPLSPFFLFVNDFENEFVKKQPNIKRTEMVRFAALKWKEMTAQQKQGYLDKYRSNIAIYKDDVQKYEDSLSTEQKEEIKEAIKDFKLLREAQLQRVERKKKASGLDKPKRPCGPFGFFLKDYRKTHSYSNKEMVAKAAEAWNSLSSSAKQKYLNINENAAKKYEKELKEWESQMIEQGNHDVVRVKTLKKAFKF